ncbi:MAG: helix-turn-helix transcriptional regulator [Bacteroidia bacterium]
MPLTKSEADFLKRVGRNIKAIRDKKGVSQTELADLCGFERSTTNRIESGGSNVTAKTLLKIAKALDVPVTELVK